jgi:flagellar hook-length control protein FliK
MNTIVPSAPKPPAVAPAQSAADNSGAPAASNPNKGFAAAMENASAGPAAKSARKNSPTKTSADNADGSKLPAAGNAVPPVSHPLPQTASAASAASATTTGAATASGAVAGTAAAGAAAGVSGATGSAASNSSQAPAGTDQASVKKPPGSVQANAGSIDAADGPEDADDTDDTSASGAEAVSGQNSKGTDTGTVATTTLPVGAQAGASQNAATVKLAGAQQSRTSRPTAESAGETTAVDGSDAAANSAADSAATNAGLNGDAASAANSAVDTDPTAAVAAQNSAYSSSSAPPVAGAAVQGNTPDAATTLAAAGASATAAVVSSAARVITALAASTTVDEKHVRGGAAAAAPVVATPGLDGSAGATQGATSVPAQSAEAATATMKVGANVDSNDFSQGVANQISTMVDRNITSAKLQVNPPSLGPIEVRIAVQGDHAQVWMVSHSAVTRDALQSSTPTLREMLNGQGFGQVSVDISQRSFQDRTPTPQTYEWKADAERSDHSAASSSVGSTARAASGALDAYA